jgi:hypothetical protein
VNAGLGLSQRLANRRIMDARLGPCRPPSVGFARRNSPRSAPQRFTLTPAPCGLIVPTDAYTRTGSPELPEAAKGLRPDRDSIRAPFRRSFFLNDPAVSFGVVCTAWSLRPNPTRLDSQAFGVAYLENTPDVSLAV